MFDWFPMKDSLPLTLNTCRILPPPHLCGDTSSLECVAASGQATLLLLLPTASLPPTASAPSSTPPAGTIWGQSCKNCRNVRKRQTLKMGEMKQRANQRLDLKIKIKEEAEYGIQCKAGRAIVRIVHLIETLKTQSTISLNG